MTDRVSAEALQWAALAVVGDLVEAALDWLDFGDPERDPLFIQATNAAMRAGVKVWSKTR